tara:strand:+ start:1528 stop:1815 length:288 start_codon:yes stop_codon:yes gene_type:complete
MSIPKKYKKQVKAAMKSSNTSERSSSQRGKKRKVTWNFKKGDLVEYKSSYHFIIDDSRGDAWFQLMTADGRQWVKAKELTKLQTLPEDTTPHANE